MPLNSGERLGPYEIADLLGKGGMGEVYRAHDTRLGRDVAIKVSAKQFSERFEREARAIAALNHPNICTLFDVGPNYLVMELVEGPTLAERIKEGAIPLEESLKIARQIADALSAAHEIPIIHRDLKPANIKIKPDGAVKVLDFGLAKIATESPTQSDATLTLGATQPGAVLGTPAYMAPEQARGKQVTKSIDIWAFGVIFHEMLTGERTFVGDDITMTLASVVMKEPDLAPIPHKVRRLIKKCLEKDPKNRLHDIADVWDYLDEPVGQAPGLRGAPSPASKLPYILAAASLLSLIALAAWTFYPRPTVPNPGAIRFTIAPPEGTVITVNSSGAPQLAVSPDGKHIAFVADETGKERTIWVRALGSLSAQRLDKTDGASFPFWSPDSQHIAFFAENQVKRIPVSGGSPVKVADAGTGNGGTWFQDAGGEGVIVFAANGTSPLQRVPASGGVPTPFTKLAEGETAHIFPQFIPDRPNGPDGKRVLYWARGGKQGIYVQALGSEERTFVRETSGRSVFSPPNFLLFLSDGTLMAQRFDPATLKVEGEPVSITDEVRNGGANGRNAFSISANGVLAYRSGGGGNQLQLAWYSRDGKQTGVALPAGPNGPIELSPDDKFVAVSRGTGNEQDLWLLDLTTGVFSRLTSSPGSESDFAWAPDSRRIVFRTEKEIRETVIGSGKETTVYAANDFLEDWTPDGKQLVIRNGNTVAVIPAPEEGSGKATESKPQLLLDAPFNKDQFRISPDGKWVAYMSRESGTPQVHVAAFPSFTNRRQISTGGAAEPLWRADGKELFFRNGGGLLMAVDVKAGATFESGPIRTLFQGSPVTSPQVHLYAVTRDGQRFLMEEPLGVSNNTVEQLYVIANWPALVK